ncbi:hypothetical protein SAY86_002922 [Trapa natans]|uniref:RRM domain-containing protein n=1 Tax=Trapa natans TaxID=22666 RepID=A0AAN7LRX4_TRANT|nr:hypothetical protein SAY86_002922 [Trapa natans]
MDSNEATTIVLSKIKCIDPDNATKIMGYLLIQDLSDMDLIRLAFGPDTLLRSLINKAKAEMGLLPGNSPSPCHSTPASPSPILSSIARPSNPAGDTAQFMPLSSPRLLQRSELDMGGSPRNPIWSGPISPSTNSSLPFVGRASFYRGNSSGGGSRSRDFAEEQQMGDFFPFLNDTGDGSSSESRLHRRSASENDASFDPQDGVFYGGTARRPCGDFTRGFCKTGSDHADDSSGPVSAFSGSPSSFDEAQKLLMLKLAHQQRVISALSASQFVPGSSPISPSKYISSLLQQQQQHGDPHRLGMIIEDDIYKHAHYQQERNGYMGLAMPDRINSASRQIYLTFPADSTFKDEDVSEYFSCYGPVQDVRIPYQQKRMFGFVTFVFSDTVKLILSKGNPHFICSSRVLVKPYKEKGKVPEKRQLSLQQQFERGDFSPSNSFKLDSGEPYDYIGYLNNTHEMFKRRLEEQAELLQAMDLQGRRLVNLQLPDLKNGCIYNHQRLHSLSLGSSSPIPIISDHNLGQNMIFPSSEAINQEAEDNCITAATASTVGAAASEQQLLREINDDCYNTYSTDVQRDDATDAGEVENHEKKSVEDMLPDSPFASHVKSVEDHPSGFTGLANEICESSSKSVNDPGREVPLSMISSSNEPSGCP